MIPWVGSLAIEFLGYDSFEQFIEPGVPALALCLLLGPLSKPATIASSSSSNLVSRR